MDAVNIIVKHIDVEKILDHYNFKNIKHEGDFIRSCCKIHDGDNPTAFVISKTTGLWFCHTGGCGGGDIFTLIEKMEDVDFTSAVRWIASFLKIDITNLQIIERKADYVNELSKFIKLMKGKRKKTLVEFHIDEEIREVSKFRNFTEETMRNFKLGFVENVKLKKKDGEDYTLYNRLVFPVIFKGIQVGIAFRRTKSTDFPKWSNQPVSIESGEILYNYDATLGKSSIIICEGITDVWAFHEIGLTAVACFGAHITSTQYKLLLQTGADLIFAFDGDETGRTATKKAIDMFKYKANISVVEFNDGEDPENISRRELMKRYEGRKKL